MAFSDNFFKKIEKKTNVDKDTILSLASKLQQGNMKDESTLREVIHDISRITGREVDQEKEQKIIDTIMTNNGVPKSFNDYLKEEENQILMYLVFLLTKSKTNEFGNDSSKIQKLKRVKLLINNCYQQGCG